jgi:tetratricopeptide (TPR) repeat protein
MSEPFENNRLNVYFDLSVSPIGYDFVTFLIMAELERIKLGCSSINLVVVPAPGLGFRDDPKHDSHFNFEQKKWRVKNLILPIASLIPSCQQIVVCQSREHALEIERHAIGPAFPNKYTTKNPTQAWELFNPIIASCLGYEIPSLQASPQALDYVQQWINGRAGGRKVISITLRESSWHLFRNSNNQAWADFSNGLDSSEYFPVILRDFEKLSDAPDPVLDGITMFPEGVANLELRAAFYELCYLNMFVANGPVELAFFNNTVRYLLIKAVSDKWLKEDPNPQGGIGMKTGMQFPFATPFHKWVWEADDFDVIKREFELIVSKIESNKELAFSRISMSLTENFFERVLEHAKTFIQYGIFDAGQLLGGKLMQIERSDPRVYTQLGWAYLGLLKYDIAISHFEKALSLAPGVAQHEINIGDVSAYQGELDVALEKYRKALRMEPNNLEAKIKIGRVLEQCGNLEDAAEVYEELIAGGVANSFLYERYGTVLKGLGRFKESVEYLFLASK